MKTYAMCPVSDSRVNERATRINAIITFTLMLVFAYTQNIAVVAFLAVDFLFRATGNARFSLIGLTSNGFVRYLSIEGRFINAGPKIFASRIGFMLSGLILITHLISFNVISNTLVAVLALFSFLEGALGLCVACKLYPLLFKAFYKRRFQGM